MRYLKLTIAYDGTDFVGWQVQPNGISVQAVLETAWLSVTGETLRITASGRTDSGVHALGQVCSLGTNSTLETHVLLRALNNKTPKSLSILQVQEAPEKFHAIRDATQKTYRYSIQHGRIRDPFDQRYRWFTPRPLNVEQMCEAAQHLLGTHDFSSFEAAGSDRVDRIRTIFQLNLKPTQWEQFRYLDIEITANGFLYNMVRNIVGTLAVVGHGRESPSWVREVLQQQDRQAAGPTAPAHGLRLVSVKYGSENE